MRLLKLLIVDSFIITTLYTCINGIFQENVLLSSFISDVIKGIIKLAELVSAFKYCLIVLFEF